MPVWEFCTVSYAGKIYTSFPDPVTPPLGFNSPRRERPGQLEVIYYSPTGIRRDQQDFTPKDDPEAIYNAFMVKFLGAGWEPYAISDDTGCLYFKRLCQP